MRADDVEHQIRAELSRIVESARGRRRLSERAALGDDEATRRQVRELGILDALPGALRHVLAAVEEAAVGLVAPDLLGSLWTALALPHDERGPILLRPTAVAWPGFLAGPEPVRLDDGAATGRLGYVPGGAQAEHLVLVLPDAPAGGAGAVVGVVALDGSRREPLPVLDPGRPAAAVELSAAPTRVLAHLSTVDIDRLRAGWLVALASDCLGGMRAAQDAAVDYARQRTAFGRAIGGFQAVRHRCADMFVDVEASRAVVRGAVAAVEADAPDALVLALAAASQAMDAYCRVAESSILVHGALGFTYECDAHFHARRAYGNAALLGGVDRLRAELATA